MIVLIIGLVLWSGLHLLRSKAPNVRQRLSDQFGGMSKGIISVGILLSLVLMIAGYRMADFIPIWSPPAFFTHINNLLMVLAIYVFFTTVTKPGTAWIMGDVGNPQLMGFTIWAFAHLLVNGDLASVLLFGGLLVWGFAEVKASKVMPSLVDRSAAPVSSPFVHLGVVVAALVVIIGVHTWLGVSPVGG